ncbi:MAG TPA: MFS transporter [Caldithrix sp.]|nr:MFS transporter [Caldithrix sp.]
MQRTKRAIWSWALYDWANSAYTTTIMAGFFPIFFKVYWANPDNPTESTFYLGLANSAASILIALLAPFLGAVADRCSARKKFLATFAFLGMAMTSGLWLVAKGEMFSAICLYFAATVGWSGANVFYDSLLVTVAPKNKFDSVSALGYALGYIGGGILFLLNVVMYLKPAFFGIPDGATAIRLAFLSVAVWWVVFSIPVFLFVKETGAAAPPGMIKSVRAGWQQLWDTLAEIKRFSQVAVFLLAYWLYIDGVDTIVRMAVDYGKSLQFSNEVLLTSLLLVQFVAFPAALFYGWLAGKIGVKKAILSGITGYIFISVFGYFMVQEWHFYFLAFLVALFQGGIQALSRSLYARIIPHDKSAEFFGFYNMLGKFSAVIGPVMMGSLAYLLGNVRFGILSIVLLFVSGGLILTRVNIREGERIAREYLSD